MKLLRFSIFVLSCLLPVFAAAKLKLADAFGDAMVIQRDISVPVWGTADPDVEVSVSFAGQKKTTRASATGEWQVKLSPLVASSENRNLTVSDGTTTVEYEKVLVGEVWLCSGQSNMEQGILHRGTYDGAKEAAKADFPLIRIRYAKRATSSSPRTNFQGSSWRACSPESLKHGNWDGFTAVGYLFGKELHQRLNVPVGIIQCAWGGTRIEPWTTPEGFKSVPELSGIASARNRKISSSTPSALYNAMIHPLVPYAIRGAIWYQGESNRGETDYAAKMRALIQGWRIAWNQGDFPFYYVQLAPFIYERGNAADRLAVTWEQQTLALEIPNTGMIVTTDIGNLRDIHPGNKRDVSARLARLALSRIYDKKFTDDASPLFKNARIESPKKIIVEFTNVNSGLTTRDGKPPSHFEVAGRDGIFHPATATIVNNTVEVSCEELTSLKQVRFAWTESAEPNLINGDKLPAGPFRWKAK
ncbi:MAG: sialate O-acetylesterase [Puniceicoccales bacterium]|jgi:sialate O-acetylesterase|nr:sialate O-acetylesterase [Puniceicoccales bacterium]